MKKIFYILLLLFTVTNTVQGQNVLKGSATDTDYNKAFQYACENLLLQLGADVSIKEKYSVTSSDGVVDKNYESDSKVKNKTQIFCMETSFDYDSDTDQFTVVCIFDIERYANLQLDRYEAVLDLSIERFKTIKKTYGDWSRDVYWILYHPFIYKYATREKWNGIAKKEVEFERSMGFENPSSYVDDFLKEQQIPQ